MSKKLALITGAGSGIGQALSLYLADLGHDVLAVGRRPEPLAETQAAYPERITTVAADVATAEGRLSIIEAQGKNRPLDLLVHNAALLAPTVPLAQVELADWRYHMAVNVEAPLFLSQALLGRMGKGSRILHISSGAAHNAYQGWGAYCTSKAALNMLYRLWNLELVGSGISVGTARPGVVNTAMQAEVRATPEDVFPDVARFKEFEKQGVLTAPDEVARFLAWLLLSVDEKRFAEEEWDLRDQAQHGNAYK